MERMEREQLKELVRDENWRRRMQAVLEMTAEKDGDELDGEEVDMLTDYLCRLVPEEPEDINLIDWDALRRAGERSAKRNPPPEPEEEEPEPYTPWRNWKPEDWCRFLEDTGVCERPRGGQRRFERQMEELLDQMKEERRRRARRSKLVRRTVLWAILFQLGGICCGILWRAASVLGKALSLPTWSACGLLGFLTGLAVLAAIYLAGGTDDDGEDDDLWEWEDE